MACEGSVTKKRPTTYSKLLVTTVKPTYQAPRTSYLVVTVLLWQASVTAFAPELPSVAPTRKLLSHAIFACLVRGGCAVLSLLWSSSTETKYIQSSCKNIYVHHRKVRISLFIFKSKEIRCSIRPSSIPGRYRCARVRTHVLRSMYICMCENRTDWSFCA